jgi:hypothetical protein
VLRVIFLGWHMFCNYNYLAKIISFDAMHQYIMLRKVTSLNTDCASLLFWSPCTLVNADLIGSTLTPQSGFYVKYTIIQI